MLIRTEQDRMKLIEALKGRKLPLSIEIRYAKHRTVEQNKLQRKWLQEASEWTGHTTEELRAHCKLHFGVPILRNENEKFREQYDKIVKPYSIEEKLQFMMEPFDFPVTRLMTTVQKTQYLDMMYKHFVELGCILTVPNLAPVE